jgi:hypothetical protein
MAAVGKYALTLALWSICSMAAAWYPSRALVEVEVVDRADGRVLPVYRKDGRAWIVGTPRHEYALRLRNLTGARVLAVTSVDGVNVVSGDDAAPSQSGYVLDPYGTQEIAGWRKSLERTAAFYFTDLGDSYAARTGRPDNVGVIGVAVFRERAPLLPTKPRSKLSEPLAAAPQARDEAAAERQREFAAAAPAPSLGTGHGRSEWSQAQVVRFDRESATPNETIAIRYDRYETLVAMGVIAGPPIARSPDPFPAWPRFVPDPK